MLKRLVPFLCCLILFNAVNAQLKNAEVFYKDGLIFKLNNNPIEALNSFNQAISINKKFDSAYVEIGNILFAGGKMDDAIVNYNKALAINPNYSNALFGMGKIYRDAALRKNYDSAIIYFSAAEKIDKTNKELYYSMAWIYNAKQQYDKAIPFAVKALEIDNTYKPAYGELGHAYRGSKKYAEGVEQFKKNIAISVVDVAMLYCGYCYIELNNKEGATQQYEALMKVNERMAGALKKKIDAMGAATPQGNN